MNNKAPLIFVSTMIFLSTMISGCLNNQVEDNNSKDIFESDVVNLLNYSIELNKNNSDIIIEAIVNGIVENLVDRNITINITAKFYNKNNDLLGESWYIIHGLRVKPKPGFSTSFTITYDEINIAEYDHIKILATEISK